MASVIFILILQGEYVNIAVCDLNHWPDAQKLCPGLIEGPPRSMARWASELMGSAVLHKS